jgi:hypothetical protein
MKEFILPVKPNIAKVQLSTVGRAKSLPILRLTKVDLSKDICDTNLTQNGNFAIWIILSLQVTSKTGYLARAFIDMFEYKREVASVLLKYHHACVLLHAFLTLALDGSEWSASSAGLCIPGEVVPGTH